MPIYYLEEVKPKPGNLSDTKLLYMSTKSSPKIWRAPEKLVAPAGKPSPRPTATAGGPPTKSLSKKTFFLFPPDI